MASVLIPVDIALHGASKAGDRLAARTRSPEDRAYAPTPRHDGSNAKLSEPWHELTAELTRTCPPLSAPAVLEMPPGCDAPPATAVAPKGKMF